MRSYMSFGGHLNALPVGTICCRFETQGDQTNLYLMTMGVLAVSPRID